MSTHDFQSWSPQAPPDDFADTMVATMLADGAPHAEGADTVVELHPSEEPGPRRRLGWKVGGLLLAAFLVGGTSWAMFERQPEIAVEHTTDVAPEPALIAPVVVPMLEVPTAQPEPATPTSRVARAQPPPPPAEPEMTIEGGDEVPVHARVPRCDCAHQFTMCSCVGDE